MARTFQAVFIGAGHNALAAAMHMAVRGRRVAVFEAGPLPGGAVKTGEYTLPGFRHDWAAMNLSMFAGSAFFKAHGEELGRHGSAFVPVDRPFASSFPDGSWLGVSTDLAETVARISALSPRDGETWQALAAGFGADLAGAV